jgi:hypothetical protein
MGSEIRPRRDPVWTRARRALALELRRRPAGMRALQVLRVAAAPREYPRRRDAEFRVLSAGPGPLRVDPELGWSAVAPDELPGLAAVLAAAREVRAAREPVLAGMLARRDGKHRIVFDLLSDAELARRPELVAFALQDALVRVATEYLGTLPVLRRVGLGISSADPLRREPFHSQLFHLDGEDFAQLKLLVNVSHVSLEDGPFTFLDARSTRRVLDAAGLQVRTRIARRTQGGRTTTPRFSDDEVARRVGESAWVRLLGGPGTAILVDTSRCLHFGSRLEPGRERLVLGAVFQRYHLVNESPFNCIEPAPVPRHPFERLLLTQPRPIRAGTFFPEPDPPGPEDLGMRDLRGVNGFALALVLLAGTAPAAASERDTLAMVGANVLPIEPRGALLRHSDRAGRTRCPHRFGGGRRGPRRGAGGGRARTLADARAGRRTGPPRGFQ